MLHGTHICFITENKTKMHCFAAQCNLCPCNAVQKPGTDSLQLSP